MAPNPSVRQEALEKLWDAWERAKTLEKPGDKEQSTRILLDQAAAAKEFRSILEREARLLTDAGNALMIRHTEVGKEPIRDEQEIDYLFHVGFAMIELVLRKTNRLSSA